MAKKFAAIDGLHTIFDFKVVSGVTTNEYDLSTFKDSSVNHNTICFISVDAEDVDNVIGNHTIKEDDRFIIVQNDVFSLYGSLQVEPTPEEQTWRPILINGATVIRPGDENSAKLDFTDSDYLVVTGDYDIDTRTLAVKYDLDYEKIIELIESLIPVVPTPPDVGDGELQFEIEKEKVHTEDGGTERDIEIDQNTISIKTVHEEEQTTTDPDTNEETTITEEIEGNFSANTPDNHTVKIHYKGTADRVDWYAEGETRNVASGNESEAKKFVYVEGLSQYFKHSSDFPYVQIKKEEEYPGINKIISQDSIVFITCALGDSTIFENEEYYAGARFIWTQGRMFSTNTWLPIFTRETEDAILKGITPPIGSSPHGGRLIFQGKGGIIVDNTTNDHDTNPSRPWEHERIITIDGSALQGQGGGGGSTVQWSQIQQTGTPIATVIIDGNSQTVYAPDGQAYEVLSRDDVEIIFNSNP